MASRYEAQDFQTVFLNHRDTLDETEDLLGEIAEQLAETADALTYAPGSFRLVRGFENIDEKGTLVEREWPTFSRLAELIDGWRNHHRLMMEAWAKLAPEQQRGIRPAASLWRRGPVTRNRVKA